MDDKNEIMDKKILMKGHHAQKKTKIVIVLCVTVVAAILTLSLVYGRQIFAKVAFDKGNYQKVVQILDGKTNNSEELRKMNSIAKAMLAYDKGDYSEVVAYLGQYAETEELKELLSISKAYVAYENEDYVGAYGFLNEIGNEEIDIYNDCVDKTKSDFRTQIDESVKQYKSDSLCSGLNEYSELFADDELEEYLYNKLIKMCEKYDYDTFLLIQTLIEKLPDGTLKDKIETYYSDNTVLRVKAYLSGSWLRRDENGKFEYSNKIVFSGDTGVAINEGPEAEGDSFKVGDVVWEDIIIISEDTFKFNTVLKYNSSGEFAGYSPCTAKIDYDNDCLKMHSTIDTSDGADFIFYKAK